MKEKKNLKPFPCTKFCYIFGSNWCTHDPSWHHQILGVGVNVVFVVNVGGPSYANI